MAWDSSHTTTSLRVCWIRASNSSRRGGSACPWRRCWTRSTAPPLWDAALAFACQSLLVEQARPRQITLSPGQVGQNAERPGVRKTRALGDGEALFAQRLCARQVCLFKCDFTQQRQRLGDAAWRAQGSVACQSIFQMPVGRVPVALAVRNAPQRQQGIGFAFDVPQLVTENQALLGKGLGLDILVEGDGILLNIYHVIEVNPAKWPKVNAPGAKAFADFMVSKQVQKIIKTFGVDKYGSPLFFPDAGKKVEDLGK